VKPGIAVGQGRDEQTCPEESRPCLAEMNQIAAFSGPQIDPAVIQQSTKYDLPPQKIPLIKLEITAFWSSEGKYVTPSSSVRDGLRQLTDPPTYDGTYLTTTATTDRERHGGRQRQLGCEREVCSGL